MKELRVLGISEHFLPARGGTVSYVANLAAALGELCDLRMMVSTPEPVDSERWCHADGYELYRHKRPRAVGYNTRIGRRSFTFAARRRLPAIVREFDPDVVHVMYGHNVATLLQRLPPRVASIWTVHNVPPNEYGSIGGWAPSRVNAVVTGLYRVCAGYVHRRRLRKFANGQIVTISDRVAERLVCAGVLSARISVVEHGIDTSIFKPGPCSVSGIIDGTCHPVLLSVGGIVPHKNQLTIVEAVSLLREKYPRVIYMNIGDVRDSTYFDRVKALAREREVEGNCIFIASSLEDTELADYYRRCDAYLQPSLDEGFGLAALEAAACGAQVIATAAGRVSQVIRGLGVGVCVTSPGNARELSQAIDAVLRQPRNPDQEKRSHRYVEEHFSWRRTAQRTLDVYDAAVSRLRT